MPITTTEASPPPAISFIHFLCGLGGMLAAALLLAWEPMAMLTRWHPATLAAVHLFALGGLMPVMLGALYQFVPVASGLALPRWRGFDYLILVGQLAGAGLLAAAFLGLGPVAFGAAGLLLGLSLLAAAARLLWALWAQAASGVLVALLRANGIALCVTVLLGLLLVAILMFDWSLPLVAIVDAHALWALAGWVGGLIVSVASVVVPMFHVTGAYPARWARAARLLPLLLLAGSVALWLELPRLAQLVWLLLALGAAVFGYLTLRRVLAARRGERDAFHWGWLGVSLLCLLLAASAAAATLLDDARWGMAFGVLALVGLGGGTVSVMLYRIVPFLIWLHWQRANKARARLPLLHQIVPERWQRGQLAAELLALGLLLGACFLPALTLPGALLYAGSKLLQAGLLARAMRDFRQRLAILRSLPPKQRASHAG